MSAPRSLRDARALADAYAARAALERRCRALELAAQAVCLLLHTARPGDEDLMLAALRRLKAVLEGAE